MVEVTDYSGMVSGSKIDKSKRFETFYGRLKTAPTIKDDPYSLECKLVQSVDLPADELFIGEIVAAHSDNRYLTKGLPDLHKIDPFVLSMTESGPSKIGAEIGKV